jgi:hypothetical protein
MQQKAALDSGCYGENYSSKYTAILIVDPFNDFYQSVVNYGLVQKKPSKA